MMMPALHILTQAASVDSFTRVESQGKQSTEIYWDGICTKIRLRYYMDKLVVFLCLTCRQSHNIVISNLFLVWFRQYTFFLIYYVFLHYLQYDFFVRNYVCIKECLYGGLWSIISGHALLLSICCQYNIKFGFVLYCFYKE